MKSFDDIFDEFLNSRKPTNNDETGGTPNLENLEDNKKGGLNSLGEDLIGDLIPSILNDNLGEPNEIEFYEEDGLFYQKKSWYVNGVKFSKILISDTPLNMEPIIKELTLEEKLEEAIAEEDYEKAAFLRDEIKNKK